MNDMRGAIVPKSDQLNADDLLTGPITITVSSVNVKPTPEQPVAISYEGDKGKPYKPCKSMCRVLVSLWGPDAAKYAGRSMTLYCDPKVRWGGMEVGGIRISHLSHIEGERTLALTMTKGNKRPHVVKPLAVAEIAYITESQALKLDAMCTDNGIDVKVLKDKAGVEKLSLMEAARFDGAVKWINGAIAKLKADAAAAGDVK